jgi:hypothetical protein
MATSLKDKKVSDMTVGELQDIIRATIQEAVDPDCGLELRDEFISEILESKKSIERGEGVPLEDVKKQLGLV